MITSIKDARRELKPTLSSDTSNNAYLVQALRAAERRFVDRVGFDFVPAVRTLELYDAYRDDRVLHNGIRLMLPGPLLAASALANGVTALAGNDYQLVALEPTRPTMPYAAVRLISTVWAADSLTTPNATITGTWGYHADYANAWLTSGDTVRDNPLTSGATSLTVADADGADAYGETPRFSPGQVVKIESEWLEVLAVNPTTNVLTVKRGINGSTAAAHVQGTAISVWEADPAAVRAITRWVALMLDRRGAFDKLSLQGLTALEFPSDLPDDVANSAAHFRALFDTPFMGV